MYSTQPDDRGVKCEYLERCWVKGNSCFLCAHNHGIVNCFRSVRRGGPEHDYQMGMMMPMPQMATEIKKAEELRNRTEE